MLSVLLIISENFIIEYFISKLLKAHANYKSGFKKTAMHFSKFNDVDISKKMLHTLTNFHKILNLTSPA